MQLIVSSCMVDEEKTIPYHRPYCRPYCLARSDEESLCRPIPRLFSLRRIRGPFGWAQNAHLTAAEAAVLMEALADAGVGRRGDGEVEQPTGLRDPPGVRLKTHQRTTTGIEPGGLRVVGWHMGFTTQIGFSKKKVSGASQVRCHECCHKCRAGIIFLAPPTPPDP